jgi:eukaryotic-like serine/threonine-protein kinase
MSLPVIAGHDIQSLIGSGSVGAVYHGKNAAGKDCAIKVFSSMSINRKGLGQVLRAMQEMPPHRGILPVLSFETDRSPYYSATPLVGSVRKEGSRHEWVIHTLEGRCGKETPDEAWRLIYELADGIAWMHKHGIAHGNLRCCNIMMSEDTETTTRISDPGQGWVGGVYHIELYDHFMHLAPEQCEVPDQFFAGSGALGSDVYAFGVIAYRLLTGRFPRADQAWLQELNYRQVQAAKGLSYAINNATLLQAIRSEPEISWPAASSSKWEERRRKILEKALSLDPHTRYRDLREITRHFELLESDYLLEQAREETAIERNKQKGKLAKLHVLWTSLAACLIAVGLYAGYSTVAKRNAESSIATHLAEYDQEKQKRDTKIAGLVAELETAYDSRKKVDDNLQRAQLMVDQLLTQLLQLPTGNNLEITFTKKQHEDAVSFLLASLPDLEKTPDLISERCRAYGNLGMLLLKQRKVVDAASNLDKARKELTTLLASDPNGPHSMLYHQWMGRFSLLLGNIKSGRGDGEGAMALFKEATAHLDPGIQANPKDRNARYEAARAWFDYGVRCRLQGDLAESAKALERVEAALDEKVIGSRLMPEESFLLARGQLERGLAVRDQGKFEEAVSMLVTSVEHMANLVAGTAPRNQEQAILLAEAYTEFADIVGKHFSAQEATEAHFEGVKLLLELQHLDPDWIECKYWLARNYGQIAGLERNIGNSKEALAKKNSALELMNEVLAEESDNKRYLFLQAKLRGELAELMCESGKGKEAIAVAENSLSSLRKLLASLSTDRMTPERREWEVELAVLHGVHGQANEAARIRNGAKTAYLEASKQWQKLASLDQNSEIIKEGQNWTRNKLEKLK